MGILAAAAVPLKKAAFQTRYLEFFSPNTYEALLFPFYPIFCLRVRELMTADSLFSAGVVAMTNVCYLLRVRLLLHYSHFACVGGVCEEEVVVGGGGGLKRGRCGGTLITRSASKRRGKKERSVIIGAQILKEKHLSQQLQQ